MVPRPGAKIRVVGWLVMHPSNFVVSLIHVFISCFNFVYFYAYIDYCVTGHRKEGDCKEHGCNAIFYCGFGDSNDNPINSTHNMCTKMC